MPFDNSTTWLSGCIPDLPTQFDEAGEVDLTALAGLCERQIKVGASAIVVGETTGEFTTLTSAELDAIIRTAAGAARGRVRVIAGAGSNSTNEAVERTRRAELAGADAILSVVPYYNKPMQAGIEAHFRAIANATALPVVLHDNPARTVRELADGTLLKLSESPQFVGLMDSTGDLSRPARLRPMLPARFRLLSGDDTTALAFLCSGGDGSISIASNIAPAMFQRMFSSYRQGRMQSAQCLQQRLLPLAALIAKENPAAVKYALSLLGLARADTRLPLAGLSDPAKASVADALEALGENDIMPDGKNASPAISAQDRAYNAAPGDIS
ncbi:4-hydroxy-tetrahydrodipicolinate synthase [Bradyrhizobium sp.]|uniref:4-hydroxy-tetrahydrodipicolinate synthase n=1 Tax=Bradyrhizobium sp. TaxID=376 RepID=UPI003C417BA5